MLYQGKERFVHQYQFPNLQIIILAAGHGTRMRSAIPKVLHKVLGKSMLEHVLHTAENLTPESMTVVVGHEAEKIKDAIGNPKNLHWIHQREQLGTGHAVLQCQCVSGDAEHALIVCGDTPLLTAHSLAALVDRHIDSRRAVSMLTAVLDEPFGYGRVCRHHDGSLLSVVEDRDATEQERKIHEVNSGIFCVRKEALFALLQEVDCDNDQQEYYLPDIIPLALSQGMNVGAESVANADEITGINNRAQLAFVEDCMQKKIIHDWQMQGVTVEQSQTVRIEASAKIGSDVCIRSGSQILGSTSIGDGCSIGPYSIIEDSWVDDNVFIEAFSHVLDAHVGSGSVIGPFARLRPEAKLDEGVRVGNFVEIKKAVIGEGSKVNHLSYIGDTVMGKHCNIGAGTITCNYDGANKHQTLIGDDVFVGSDTKLVAPVEVKSGATIGAGSIITKTVNENGLTLSARPEQRHVREWRRPKKY